MKTFTKPTLAALLLVTVVLAGCELVNTTDEHEIVVEGVSFTELFREPTSSELDNVVAEWSLRNTAGASPQIHRLDRLPISGRMTTLLIISHSVGGVTHYGAIISPDGGANDSRPVIVYAHGGDDGVSVDEEVLLVLSFLGDNVNDYVYVIPSYRSEELRYDNETWTSGGAPSPWDYDVDDTMSLLSVADALSPTADMDRVAVLGQSRGGGVALLMGIRDPRVDQVIDFYGPTDFFGTFVQEVTEEALKGTLRDLPGLDHLNTSFIQPLKSGSVTINDVRPELIRRSAVLFVDRIPDLQVHHGTADETVPVSQGQSLVQAMQIAGRTEPGFESYIYPGGGHNPFTLEGSFERTATFLSRLLDL